MSATEADASKKLIMKTYDVFTSTISGRSATQMMPLDRQPLPPRASTQGILQHVGACRRFIIITLPNHRGEVQHSFLPLARRSLAVGYSGSGASLGSSGKEISLVLSRVCGGVAECATLKLWRRATPLHREKVRTKSCFLSFLVFVMHSSYPCIPVIVVIVVSVIRVFTCDSVSLHASYLLL